MCRYGGWASQESGEPWVAAGLVVKVMHQETTSDVVYIYIHYIYIYIFIHTHIECVVLV